MFRRRDATKGYVWLLHAASNSPWRLEGPFVVGVIARLEVTAGLGVGECEDVGACHEWCARHQAGVSA